MANGEPIVNRYNGFVAQATGDTGAGVVGNSFGRTSSGSLGAETIAVQGVSGAGSGHPTPTPAAGVWGDCDSGNGVYGASATWNGVEGDTWSSAHAGVAGTNHAGGPAVWGSSTGNAGQFDGNVLVTGNLTANGNIQCDVASLNTVNAAVDVVLGGGDCAEHFDLAEEGPLEPGTVVVIDEDGAVRQSRREYDKRVAGVVSGAGGYKPGIVLDRRVTSRARTLVALVGKVYCKVDATDAPIVVGDLLTASRTPGHAMKANDPRRAFGAVIGKALASQVQGQGLIPILVALQ